MIKFLHAVIMHNSCHLIKNIVYFQRRRRKNRSFHCHRLNARTFEAWKDYRRLWSRDMPTSTAKLHGPDRRSVHFHSWSPSGSHSGMLKQNSIKWSICFKQIQVVFSKFYIELFLILGGYHGSALPKPSSPHSAADANGAGGEHHGHGDGV